MSDRINVFKNAQSLETAEKFDGYSKVIINVGTDENGNYISYEAGDDSGRTLEFSNDFGTQAMANNVLQQILGYQYQPLKATKVLLDPSAEIGDGISIDGNYSGIFVRSTNFNTLMASDIEAPVDEEIDHEYAVETASNRQYTRFVANTKSMIRQTQNQISLEVEQRQAADTTLSSRIEINATNITNKVSKTGGNGSTFGWTLTDNSWTVWSGSQSNPIITATASGLEVKGKITATSGEIGGFTINSNNLSYNSQAWGGTNTTGIYIGSNGIQCGSYESGFSVTNTGYIKAVNANLSGTLTVGGQTIDASVLRAGAQSAYTNGSAWSTGASYAGNFQSMADNGEYGGYKASYINTGHCYCDSLWVGSPMHSGGSNQASWNYISFITGLSYSSEAMAVYYGTRYVGTGHYSLAQIDGTAGIWFLGHR